MTHKIDLISILEHKPLNIWGEKNLANHTPYFHLFCILHTKKIKAFHSNYLPCLILLY